MEILYCRCDEQERKKEKQEKNSSKAKELGKK